MNKGNIKTGWLFLAIISLISVVSCNPGRQYEKEEKAKMQNYLSANSTLDFVRQPSGLYYLETTKGTGFTPVAGDSAFVRYTGMFLSGSIFDSNATSAKLYGFVVGANISGFDEGIELMAVGGKATLLIPSSLGYGTFGSYPIAGYTPLLFDIELAGAKRATVK